MSRLIAALAISGAQKLARQAEDALATAIARHGKCAPVAFPNTAYYLPVIYAMTGIKVETLGDCEPVLDRIRHLLPQPPDEHGGLPYLGPALDAGMAALFAEEIIEGCKCLGGPSPANGIWLGAADDVLLRERGIEFVDGSAPGVAVIVGAAPSSQAAVRIARQLQERSLYVFMAGQSGGRSFAEQLAEEGVQLGWPTRLVPLGKEITAAVYALGFATRAALSFGGVQPGDYARNLKYNKNRILAFVIALGQVDEPAVATAAGALNFGFPIIADTAIPQILLPGVCTYESVVGGVALGEIVAKAIEVRGLKIKVSRVPIPVAYSPAFEGERIRKEDMHCEFGGNRSPAFEFVTTRDASTVDDGKVEVIGPEIDSVSEGEAVPLAIWVEVAGRKMQPDFEPVIERQIHRFVNAAQGLFHMGQRDIIWLRIGKDAKKAGVRFRHLGDVIHAKLHDEYNAIFDKVQVKVCTEKAAVEALRQNARAVFAERDRRLANMTDESVDTFYSCTLCQSFAPNHVCIITPERPGLCGAYGWLDGRAAHEITPTGPNQPVEKGTAVDARIGQWEHVNEFIYAKSNRTVERISAYSIITDPMTSCGCFEAISAVLPMANGIMIVDRDCTGMTPCGMKFSTLAGAIGGGNQTPGFMGHSRRYIVSRKFISGDGGVARIVWMPRKLKEELRGELAARARENGLGDDFVDKIADDTTAQSEQEVAGRCVAAGHPALSMGPMF